MTDYMHRMLSDFYRNVHYYGAVFEIRDDDKHTLGRGSSREVELLDSGDMVALIFKVRIPFTRKGLPAYLLLAPIGGAEFLPVPFEDNDVGAGGVTLPRMGVVCSGDGFELTGRLWSKEAK